MLSQRIAFVAHHVETDPDPRPTHPGQDELRQLIARFETDLSELERSNQPMGTFVAGQTEADEGLAIIREQWENYKRAAETLSSKDLHTPQFMVALRYIDDHARMPSMRTVAYVKKRE